MRRTVVGTSSECVVATRIDYDTLRSASPSTSKITNCKSRKRWCAVKYVSDALFAPRCTLSELCGAFLCIIARLALAFSIASFFLNYFRTLFMSTRSTEEGNMVAVNNADADCVRVARAMLLIAYGVLT